MHRRPIFQVLSRVKVPIYGHVRDDPITPDVCTKWMILVLFRYNLLQVPELVIVIFEDLEAGHFQLVKVLTATAKLMKFRIMAAPHRRTLFNIT